jgi:hypothetical protein
MIKSLPGHEPLHDNDSATPEESLWSAVLETLWRDLWCPVTRAGSALTHRRATRDFEASLDAICEALGKDADRARRRLLTEPPPLYDSEGRPMSAAPRKPAAWLREYAERYFERRARQAERSRRYAR